MVFNDPRSGNTINEEYLVQCRESNNPSAFEVKPGLSGWPQIKMKSTHDSEYKAYWDHRYVLRMNFFFDCGIFFYTILKLFGVVKGR